MPRNTSLKAYDDLLAGVVELLEKARRTSVRSVNAVMTATYWEVGRRIVEHEQRGLDRARYGEKLLQRLSKDLTQKFGRGFGVVNLSQMRRFYQLWPAGRIIQTLSEETSISKGTGKIFQTASEKSLWRKGEKAFKLGARKPATVSRKFALSDLVKVFSLPWSHYVRLVSVEKPEARVFYEGEALRGGWSVRQLDRQISSLFYQRTLLSRNKAAMLKKGTRAKPNDKPTPEEEIKDPLVLEFLGLKDEYSENTLEEALIHHLEHFLLELGNDFTFVARQKRLRVGSEWYRIDLLFYHRRLRCLIIIDLKIGKFTHADAGQMNLYLNYAREHWTHPDENPPVGLILCAQGDRAVAHYALGNLQNKVLAAEYKTILPDEHELVEELRRTQLALDSRLALRRLPGTRIKDK